jgi:formylglycine-generating enzyme required for sulfatase activity
MATPRQIGPYQIVEELGRGGMGVVYRAFDPAIGRPLAIKLLNMPHLAADAMAEMRQRFAREAAAAGRLSHPGIVTLYQFGQDGDSQYLAMELVPGGSLEGLIREGRGWPAREAFRVLRQIAEALDYAHAQGVVHRDIKPANVLVRSDSRVQVTDFGIARIAEETKTRTGMAMGTPSYMAPEQIHGGKVDGRADQFSLAVVAFRLLTGRVPFGAATEYAVLYRIVNGEPDSTGLPQSVDTVLRRALAKDPEARFATCSAFVTALEAVVMAPDAEPTAEITRLTVGAPVARKKAWWPWLAGAALVAAAVIGGVLYTRPETPPPVKPPHKATVAPPPAPQAPAVEDDYVWLEPGTFTMGCSEGEADCARSEKPAHRVTITRRFRIGKTLVASPDGSPMVDVSWNQARDYCEGIGMRLPTEAEWEYAARTGTVGNMLGSVWQWTDGWYGDYPKDAETDPDGPAKGKTHPLRGRSLRVSQREAAPPAGRSSTIGFRCAGN